jgi:hypothetical protein
MMSSLSSEQYEVMYTMRAELGKKEGNLPGRNGPPGPWGPRGCGRPAWM